MTENISESANTETPATETTATVTEVTETQNTPEVLGEGGKKALEAERARAKQLEKDLKTAAAKLQEFEDRDKTEIEKATSLAQTAAQERDAAVTALMRYEVAAEKGVPTEALGLLVGSSREELETKADSILAIMADSKASVTAPVVTQEGRAPEIVGSAADQFAAAMRTLL